MQALAVDGLPQWLKPDFWTADMDRILLAGIREGAAGEMKAVGKIVRLHPELRIEIVWARLRHLCALKGRNGQAPLNGHPSWMQPLQPTAASAA